MLVSALFISACDYVSSGGDEPVRGTQGVTMSFMRESLLDSVYENGLYYIHLNLKNEGAHDVENGIIALSLDDYSFSIENPDEFEHFSLRGNDGTFNGEERVQEIILKAKEITMQGVDAYDTSIKVNMCYSYKTLFQDTLCVDTDVRKTQHDKPCLTSTLSGSSGQGAPVVVSRVEPRLSPGTNGAKLSFEIFIQNSGSGTVLAKDRGEAVCTSEFVAEDFNRVTISEIKVSSYSLSNGDILCETGGTDFTQVNLDEEESITCRVREDIPYSLGTFSTPLTIKLSYDYLSSLETGVTIEK